MPPATSGSSAVMSTLSFVCQSLWGPCCEEDKDLTCCKCSAPMKCKVDVQLMHTQVASNVSCWSVHRRSGLEQAGSIVAVREVCPGVCCIQHCNTTGVQNQHCMLMEAVTNGQHIRYPEEHIKLHGFPLASRCPLASCCGRGQTAASAASATPNMIIARCYTTAMRTKHVHKQSSKRVLRKAHACLSLQTLASTAI